jgi:hypothetical protein
MIRSNFRNLAALTLFAALALSAWARADRAAAATPPSKSLPPDIAKLFDQMVGDWSAGDLKLEAGGQVMKGTSKVHCTKTESGMALQCRLLVSAPGMQIDDTNLFGWNGETGEVHLFCAGNGSPAHDHKGRFDGTTLTVENTEPRGGKPQLDRVVFTFKGPRELYWKSSTAIDGKTVFAGEGAYRR